MAKSPKPQRRVISRKLPACWLIELDDSAWAELMTGLSIAIDATSDQDRANRLRQLRTDLSKG